MINPNVRIVCLFISVGLIITVLNIVKKPQSYRIHIPQLSYYPKPAKKFSKIMAIETGILLLCNISWVINR